MDFNPAIPIYLQIMERIKKDIVTGVLTGGERIESVRSLAEKFGVNLNTIQRACTELEREKIITTQRGIGSFVTEEQNIITALKEDMSEKLVEEFLSGMQGLGYTKNEIFNLIKKAVEE